MIVITLTDCPPRVRGDLSKWLCEINTGVYVGNLSARVREELWERICENLRNGRATMVYSSNTEQGYAFRVHNTSWEPVDFDGITLMRRPSAQALQTDAKRPPVASSDAENLRLARRRQASARAHGAALQEYCVVDLETTGLSAADAQIIEMAAILVRDGDICDTFSRLISITCPIPVEVVKLTGLTDDTLEREGAPIERALPDFLGFIEGHPLVGYNISFDIAFLRTACDRINAAFPRARTVDVLELARRKLFGLPSMKLECLAEHYRLESYIPHRAMNDCMATHQIYMKLCNQSK